MSASGSVAWLSRPRNNSARAATEPAPVVACSREIVASTSPIVSDGSAAAAKSTELTARHPVPIRLRVGTPVQPMLAATAEDVATAVEELGRASVEWKLDGARIQVHRDGDQVRIYTRNLNDITDPVSYTHLTLPTILLV